MAEDVREARVVLDEVEDGGDETHFVGRWWGVPLCRAFVISVLSRSGAGADAVLKLFGVVAVTTAAVSEANVSVCVAAALFVDFANGGFSVGFAGYFAAARGDVFAEDA